ncbi:MAG: hypothetical protein WCS77_01740 [Elusimicrobiaceae bacterium]
MKKSLVALSFALLAVPALFAAGSNTDTANSAKAVSQRKGVKVSLTKQQKEIFVKTALLTKKISEQFVANKEGLNQPIRTHTECGWQDKRDAQYGMDVFLGNVRGEAEWYDIYQDSSSSLVRFCYTVGYRSSLY